MNDSLTTNYYCQIIVILVAIEMESKMLIVQLSVHIFCIYL